MRLVLALVVAGLLAGPFTSAQAAGWCGFIDKAHARVRCGFSSIKECKQALGNKKDAVCMPSPSFAKRAAATLRKG